MNTNYDQGVQEDFDNMTRELARERMVLTREETLAYDSFEVEPDGENSTPMAAQGFGKKELVQLQELNSQNEVVAAGLFKVGDVRFTFMSDSIVEEESYVLSDNNVYKVLELTKYKGMSNNIITDIRAFGKKLPNR